MIEDSYEKNYTALGKLIFKTGLPEAFGLLPGDDIHGHPEAKKAASTLAEVLQALTESEELYEAIDPYDYRKPNFQALRQFRKGM